MPLESSVFVETAIMNSLVISVSTKTEKQNFSAQMTKFFTTQTAQIRRTVWYTEFAWTNQKFFTLGIFIYI